MRWILYICEPGSDNPHHNTPSINGPAPAMGETVYYAGEHHRVVHRWWKIGGWVPPTDAVCHVYAEIRKDL